jgi:microcystin-dependent protein
MPGGGGSPFVGQIMMVGFNFAPAGWQFCDGRLLPISEFEVLFNLIGTTYGGDGQSTFALPDLRGRVPLGTGQGLGLSSYTIGEIVGVEDVTLTLNQLASHQHSYNPSASQNELTSDRPDNHYPAAGGYYASTTNSASPMGAPTVAPAGADQPHKNLQPFLGINFIISLFGIFPSRS